MFSDVYGSVTTTFIRNEVKYFAEKHELVYLAQKVTGDSGRVRTHSIPFNENLLVRKLNWYLWNSDLRCSFKNSSYSKELNAFIRKENPDVIHCHFAYEALKLLQNIDPQLKVPIFVHFHGYDASQMLRKTSYVKVVKDCLSRKNVFPLVVSLKMKQDLEDAGLPMHHTEILRYGIDTTIFKRDADDGRNNEVTFLQTSSLVEKKGHEYTIKAFSLFFHTHPLMKEKVRIIFAGEGERKEQLLKLTEYLGLSNNVSFVGPVNSQDATRLLKSANVFMHHSVTASNGDREGIPNAIMEAMAMKLPVLSTFHAGIPELVKNGVNGLLCNERDVQTYARQIEEIIHWPLLSINRELIEKKYNMVKHNLELENIYLSRIKQLQGI